MATLITHAVVGASIGFAASCWKPFRDRRISTIVIAGSTAISMLPDADVILWRLVAYNSFFGHRGFFHSPFFLVLLSFMSAGLLGWGAPRRKIIWVALVWSAAGFTHPLLDAVTDGGYGPMMFFPLSNERFFFSWRPIRVAPIGFRRFFPSAYEILRTEWMFCATAGTLALLCWAAARFSRQPQPARTKSDENGNLR